MGVSRQSLQSIMHKDLDLYPYKIQMANKWLVDSLGILPEDASNGGRGWKHVELSFHVWRGSFRFKRQHKQTKLSNMECFQSTDTPWDGIAFTSCHAAMSGPTSSKKTVTPLRLLETVTWACWESFSIQNYAEWELLSTLCGFSKVVQLLT